jgi:hypothetical protein
MSEIQGHKSDEISFLDRNKADCEFNDRVAKIYNDMGSGNVQWY